MKAQTFLRKQIPFSWRAPWWASAALHRTVTYLGRSTNDSFLRIARNDILHPINLHFLPKTPSNRSRQGDIVDILRCHHGIWGFLFRAVPKWMVGTSLFLSLSLPLLIFFALHTSSCSIPLRITTAWSRLIQQLMKVYHLPACSHVYPSLPQPWHFSFLKKERKCIWHYSWRFLCLPRGNPEAHHEVRYI